MTTAEAAARTSPGRTPQPQRIDGALFVDLEGRRARYECLRPDCPHRLEGPAYATGRGPDGVPLGIDGLKAWIDGVKTHHLAQYHGEQS